MNDGDDLQAIREQAAHWLISLEQQPSAEALAAFESWRNADRRHAQLFGQLQQLWQAVSPQAKPKRKMRNVSRVGLVLALPVALAAGQILPWQGWLQPTPAFTAATAQQAVFDGRPLPEVLAELGRHRSGFIWASDPRLQALRFTGVLPLNDSDAALALLQAALPIRVDSYGKYLVQVRPR